MTPTELLAQLPEVFTTSFFQEQCIKHNVEPPPSIREFLKDLGYSRRASYWKIKYGVGDSRRDWPMSRDKPRILKPNR